MNRLGLTLAFKVVVALAVNAGGQLLPSGPPQEKPIPCSPSLTVRRQTHSSVPAPIQLNLRHYVAPEYPQAARQARVQGDVRVSVRISNKGEVLNVQLILGHPLLARPTLKAVQQWRYKPACVDGERAAWVQTATIRFSLNNGVSVMQGQPSSLAAPKLKLQPGAFPDLSTSNTGPKVMNYPFLSLEKWDKMSQQWRSASSLSYCRGFYFGPTSELQNQDPWSYYQKLGAEFPDSLSLGTSLREIRRRLRVRGVPYDECSGSDRLRFNSTLAARPHQQGLVFSLPAQPNGTPCVRNLLTYLVFDGRGRLSKKDSAIVRVLCR